MQVDASYSSAPNPRSSSFGSNLAPNRRNLHSEYAIDSDVLELENSAETIILNDVSNDLSISEKTMGYIRQILGSVYRINGKQLSNSIRLISNLVRLNYHENLSITYTFDQEVQIFKNNNEISTFLLIDEYGGVALNKIGKPGKGYSANYFDDEEIDNRKIVDISYDFTQN